MGDKVLALQTEAGRLTKKFKDMGDGTFSEVMSITTGVLSLLWTDGSLIAAGGSVASGWVSVATYDVLRIGRTTTGGTYAFEVDWSRDGITVDFTETVAVANNTTVEKPTAGIHARLRVRNTDAVTAFTAHRTTVYGR